MSKKNNIRARIRNFYKRWNIEYDKEKRIADFKDRALRVADAILRPVFLKPRNSSLLVEYLKLIGVYISEDYLRHISRTTKESIFIRKLGSKIENASLEETIFYLEQLFWLDIPSDVKNRLYEGFKESIKLSSLLDINIKKLNDRYMFYPAGAKLLDEGVVNDVLDGLSGYSEPYKLFNSALQKYQEHKYERNLIDDLRASLESLLKDILHRNKGLEKQKDKIGEYLKDKGVPKEIRNMFNTLIAEYTGYQNEHIKHIKNTKHNDNIKGPEVEFMIYLTGTFMRFILKLEESSENVIREK